MTAQIWNEDCITGMSARLAPESVDLAVSSIPFGALFMYSGKTEDIGNNPDGVDMRASQFGLHMRFFIQQLLRVMKPGRNACIHIQQLLRYKNQHGYMGRRDFRGAVVDLFEAGGFEWIGEVAIPKNPQIIAKRLNLHCLMFETGRQNSTKLAPAVNDYVMFFQKPGESAQRVQCLHDATKNPGGWVSQEEWISWARGVWNDIRETDVLDGWKSARESGEEKHVCPLQLEVIRRCVRLYTNFGDLVLDPFMGIGSTAVVAIEQGRNAVGFELKESYHSQAERNVAMHQREPDNDQLELAISLEGADSEPEDQPV
jgi:DNA modification methylase